MPEVLTNEEQITYWNEKAGPRWVEIQERLDKQLVSFGTAVLDGAAIKPGDRVLDIGCGCGATTLDAARRTAPTGSATGADISRPMLARARERAAAASIANASFIEADAQVYPFQPEFDAVISRFGVMFFADPPTAFANIRRALKPGGRMCFICWRPMIENPWVIVPMQAAAKHIELPPPPPDPHAPGPFAFADNNRVRGILTSAGFAEVKIDKHDARLSIGGATDLDRAVKASMDIGPVNSLLADKSDDIRAKVRDSIREALRPLQSAEGVVMDWAAWVVSARNG